MSVNLDGWAHGRLMHDIETAVEEMREGVAQASEISTRELQRWPFHYDHDKVRDIIVAATYEVGAGQQITDPAISYVEPNLPVYFQDLDPIAGHRPGRYVYIWMDRQRHNPSVHWYRDTSLHREDGPAVCEHGNETWYRDGEAFREDGPHSRDRDTLKWNRDTAVRLGHPTRVTPHMVELPTPSGIKTIYVNGSISWRDSNRTPYRPDGPASIERYRQASGFEVHRGSHASVHLPGVDHDLSLLISYQTARGEGQHRTDGPCEIIVNRRIAYLRWMHHDRSVSDAALRVYTEAMSEDELTHLALSDEGARLAAMSHPSCSEELRSFLALSA